MCDAAWSGVWCEQLSFEPIEMPQGYGQSPQLNTWGGGILYEPEAQLYHAYISVMTNDCPLSDWMSNSRIDHATSNKVTG